MSLNKPKDLIQPWWKVDYLANSAYANFKSATGVRGGECIGEEERGSVFGRISEDFVCIGACTKGSDCVLLSEPRVKMCFQSTGLKAGNKGICSHPWRKTDTFFRLSLFLHFAGEDSDESPYQEFESTALVNANGDSWV